MKALRRLGRALRRATIVLLRAWRWWLVASVQVGICALVGLFGHLAREAGRELGSAAVAGALANRHDPAIRRVARRRMPAGWDWRLLKAMVRKESNYDRLACSPGGAVGLCQLMPATARRQGLTPASWFDAAANLDAGTRYLREMYDRWEGVPDRAPRWSRTRLAIASYNAGLGRTERAVAAAGGRGWSAVAAHLPSSTKGHVERIVDDYWAAFVTAIPASGTGGGAPRVSLGCREVLRRELALPRGAGKE